MIADMKIKYALIVLGGMVAYVSAAAPVYEVKDADVFPDVVKCRNAGMEVVEGDVFVRKDFWTVENYNNRLKIEVGGLREGVKGLCIDGSTKQCDTAWTATSGRIPLKGKGHRYRLGFLIDTTITIKLPNSDGENWRSMIFWYDADGKELSKYPIA